MLQLSEGTKRRLQLLFRGEECDQAEKVLVDECGDNLPFIESNDESGIERLRFAALKVSEGKIGKLKEAVDLAKIDWRDLLMAADFGQDGTAHLNSQPGESAV